MAVTTSYEALVALDVLAMPGKPCSQGLVPASSNDAERTNTLRSVQIRVGSAGRPLM